MKSFPPHEKVFHKNYHKWILCNSVTTYLLMNLTLCEKAASALEKCGFKKQKLCLVVSLIRLPLFRSAQSTVRGQNTIGIYIIPLASTQHTAQKQNIVCNSQLLKLQLAVTNEMYATTGC